MVLVWTRVTRTFHLKESVIRDDYDSGGGGGDNGKDDDEGDEALLIN